MPTTTTPPELRRAAVAYARAVRYGSPEDAALSRQALNEIRIRTWATRMLEETPALKPDTERKLRALLSDGER